MSNGFLLPIPLSIGIGNAPADVAVSPIPIQIGIERGKVSKGLGPLPFMCGMVPPPRPPTDYSGRRERMLARRKYEELLNDDMEVMMILKEIVESGILE